MNYYYKTEHGILKAKHELSEEELGQWEPITEEEYLSLKSAHKFKTSKKDEVEESEPDQVAEGESENA